MQDNVADIHTAGFANGKPAVLMIVFRQPGANIIGTVDRVYALLPQLRASISPAIDISVLMDRTTTIRASVRDIEYTLIISIVLVIFVVFVFLRNLWTTLIPSVSVPLSLIGTFGAMYLLHYSLDNLSLMALAISTGFVVDDAIVVIENITRYLEQGYSPVQAAYKGSREIGFTVLSMSTSLVAVFIPILLMGGIVGRLFREFAVTLSVAIAVSLVVSLTTTPMMCAKFLKPVEKQKHGRLYRSSERVFDSILESYSRGLGWVLRHQPFTLAVTIGTLCLSVALYIFVPKGFFPQQDTGRLMGSIQAAQDISFGALRQKLSEYAAIVQKDPAVDQVMVFSGGRGLQNSGSMFITLKALQERNPERKKVTADQVIGRLREKLAVIPGATLYIQAAQDLQIGGRQSALQFQYSLQSENLQELNQWAPQLLAKLRTLPQLRSVATDQQDKGLEAHVQVDRDTAARMGVTSAAIDSALYDAFGQRQVSTIYRPLNQYHVVMEVDPRYSQNPDALDNIYVRGTNNTSVPLGSFAKFVQSSTALGVNHQGQFPSVTLSFNLAPGVSLGQATVAILNVQRQIGMPSDYPRPVRRHGGRFPTVAFQSAVAHPGRPGHGLYRPRHSVRKLYSPDYDPLDVAVGRRRRSAGAGDYAHRPFRHCRHRDHSADWHREEKCDHDDRLRSRRGAPRGQASGRGDLSGVSVALPSHHDDHHGCPAWRPAARPRHRDRQRTAPSARHHHCRRPDREPDAHAFYHARHLSLHGSHPLVGSATQSGSDPIDAAGTRHRRLEPIPEMLLPRKQRGASVSTVSG